MRVDCFGVVADCCCCCCCCDCDDDGGGDCDANDGLNDEDDDGGCGGCGDDYSATMAVLPNVAVAAVVVVDALVTMDWMLMRRKKMRTNTKAMSLTVNDSALRPVS